MWNVYGKTYVGALRSRERRPSDVFDYKYIWRELMYVIYIGDTFA